MPRTPSYRCAECIGQPSRCVACKKRRAAALRLARAAKRECGLCVECHRTALAGYTRCRKHNKRNNAYSAASHAKP